MDTLSLIKKYRIAVTPMPGDRWKAEVGDEWVMDTTLEVAVDRLVAKQNMLPHVA